MLGLLKRINLGRKGSVGTDQTLVVVERRCEAERIISFRLEAPDGAPMRPFSPGAHVEVRLENGLLRQYSLCSDPADLSHYRIAVLLDEHSRGGSAHIHATWQAGTRIQSSGPRNVFELVESDARFHLFAGGIGITPLIPMILALKRSGRDFALHYFAKSPAHAAFVHALPDMVGRERLFLHFTRTRGRRPDVRRLLDCIPASDYVYCCGPTSLIETVRTAMGSRAGVRCRFEHFTIGRAPTSDVSRPFEVLLAQSGEIFTVPDDKSLLESLEERGYPVSSSCREGVCGACQLRYTEGEVIHRDQVLDGVARQSMLASCVSRANGHVVLDL